MTSHIYIPTKLGDKDLNAFFSGWEWRDDPPSPMVLHVEQGTHIAPWATTLLGAYAIWLKEVRNKDVSLSYDRSTYTGKFLERIGLPQVLGQPTELVEGNDEKIFPLTRITESKQISPIAASLMELLRIDDAEVEAAVKYSLGTL